MNEAGHNNPPGMIETAAETAKDISGWMAENPVIQSEESAREAKVYLDRGRLCLKDLDDERVTKVRPLNEETKRINAEYKEPENLVDGVLAELRKRIFAFVREEENKRRLEAATAVRNAADAEHKAREAERAEQEAIASADAGELGVDVAAVTLAADRAFKDYQKSDRAAALAKKESHVKIGGGISRAISAKKKETLIVTNLVDAVNAIGLTEDILEAVRKSARAYRKLRGRLPPGVESRITEEI